jgi:hypothetical protein
MNQLEIRVTQQLSKKFLGNTRHFPLMKIIWSHQQERLMIDQEIEKFDKNNIGTVS